MLSFAISLSLEQCTVCQVLYLCNCLIKHDKANIILHLLIWSVSKDKKLNR